MCGIAGILNFQGEPVASELLDRMISCVRYRGPDESRHWTAGPIGFAHARLSIIDIAGGRQPMSNQDGTLWIAFNGEIFNYVELRNELIAAGHAFSTRSDTEVILQMYAAKGEDCVRHFNGQWAFAIWDTRRSRLFLSRDRTGVRPLFYARTPGSLLFASEIKSLLVHPEVRRKLNPEALDQAFTFWSALPPLTMFEGVQELPAGHSVVVEGARLKTSPYWQLDYSAVDPDMKEDECASRLLELLDDATRLRLRSDVPVGAYLSGGLDSSIIAALTLRHSGERLKTFSVSFEDKEFDERRYQQEVVRSLDTQHESIDCSYQDICDVFPEVIRHTEAPILRTAPAPLYLLSRLVRSQGYKVVLTGEGADEFLGGYDIYKEAKIRRFMGVDLASTHRPLLLKRLYPYMGNLQAQSHAYLLAFFHVDGSKLGNPFFSHLPRWELTAKLKSFFSEDMKAALKNTDPYRTMKERLPGLYGEWDSFSQAQYLEATGLLSGYLLSSQGDRMAMANSVEGRYPFLDYRLVEFTTKIPPRLKMKVLNEKYILKRAAGHLVPASVRNRPKQPYRAPDATSFFDAAKNTPRADYVRELLTPRRVQEDGLFNPAAVEKLVEKAHKGPLIGARDNMALVGILSTQLLVDQFIRNRGGS